MSNKQPNHLDCLFQSLGLWGRPLRKAAVPDHAGYRHEAGAPSVAEHRVVLVGLQRSPTRRPAKHPGCPINGFQSQTGTLAVPFRCQGEVKAGQR